MYPRWFVSLVLLLAPAPLAHAQSLGTFKWQLQPYCNVVTVNVTGAGGVYTIDGYDDQCGAPTRAPLTGVATPNLDGTIGFGLHVVTAPGGRGLQIDARITLAALSGPWTDSDGHSGTFAFGTNTGGSPRPLPVLAPIIPATISLLADGGLLAGGSFGTGAIPASGSGTRMMWHPAKAAFRAGKVTATMWDEAETGESSSAFGLDTVASGAGSFAAGRSAKALGGSAMAFGTNTTASGGNSTALGGGTTAAGYASVAAGLDSVASGSQSVAMGSGVTAAGNFSVALGLDSRANGIGSFAAGINTIASGRSSVALGGGTSGNGALASGAFSVAIGQTLDAAGAGSMVLGNNAVTTQAAYASFVYGDASSTSVVQSFAPNEFKVRAAGGTYFFSNGAMTSGVRLAPNASAWSTLSDVDSKENFRDLDGDDRAGRAGADADPRVELQGAGRGHPPHRPDGARLLLRLRPRRRPAAHQHHRRRRHRPGGRQGAGPREPIPQG